VNSRGARALAAVAVMLLPVASVSSPAGAAADAGTQPSGCRSPVVRDLGTQVPVLLVHGFNEAPSIWNQGTPSMLTAIEAIPGVKAVSFNYFDERTSWVTAPLIGACLATWIRSLAAASVKAGGAGKVIIVAHSMGGLAIRCAVDTKCVNADNTGTPWQAADAGQIGLVITLGTPNLGSWLDARARPPLLSKTCQHIEQCAGLAKSFAAGSPAVEAMQERSINPEEPSAELARLKQWPAVGVPLDAVAGRITLTTSLFGRGLFCGSCAAELGDLAVSVPSAQAGATQAESTTIDCGYIPISIVIPYATASGGQHASALPPTVKCWHQTETTDSAFQAEVVNKIKAALPALTPAPCTATDLTSAINAAGAESPGNWTLTYHACRSGYAFVGIQPFQGLAVVAILKQQGPHWKIIYGPNEGLCLTRPLPSFCQGFKLPLPWAILRSLTPVRNPHRGHGGNPGPSSPTTPPAPASQTVKVTGPADAGWVDTGIALTPSDTVRITAAGSWTADGVNYTGPDGYTTESPDNYINLADLGACADCATSPFPEWGALMSYLGSDPPEPGSYTSTSVETQAMQIDYLGSDLKSRSWPIPGELWLAMNDDAYSGNTSDNYGRVTATITVHRR
jgi:hypothetical protein